MRRWSDTDKLIIVTNFDAKDTFGFELQIPQDIIKQWNLNDGTYKATDQLYNEEQATLQVQNQAGTMRVDIKPLQSFVFKLE